MNIKDQVFHDSLKGMMQGFTSVPSVKNENFAKYIPAVDVLDMNKYLELHVILPGIKKENIKVDIRNNKLHINSFREKESPKYLSTESLFGYFSRTVNLPDDIDQDAIEAEYLEGVLKIKLFRREKVKQNTSIVVR